MAERKAGRALLGGILASAVLVGAIVAVLAHFDMQHEVLRLLRWLEAQGGWAPLLFVLIMAGAVVMLLPALLLTTAAGFVFGIVKGVACVVLGTTLGAVAAFLIARRLFGARAARYVLEHPTLRVLDTQLAPHGWRLVFFTRLVPFFPFKLSNYFFGLTSVSLRAFAIGTFLGLMPLSLHNVYLGAIAAEIATSGARTAGFSTAQWAFYGAGLIAASAAAPYLGRLAWRVLTTPVDAVAGRHSRAPPCHCQE